VCLCVPLFFLHRYADLGYTGSGIKTPVLDHLANNGVKLKAFYVQRVSVCLKCLLLLLILMFSSVFIASRSNTRNV